MSFYLDGRFPVVARTTKLVKERCNHGLHIAKVPAIVLRFCEVELQLRLAGYVVDEIQTLWDFYGLGTAFEESLEDAWARSEKWRLDRCGIASLRLRVNIIDAMVAESEIERDRRSRDGWSKHCCVSKELGRSVVASFVWWSSHTSFRVPTEALKAWAARMRETKGERFLVRPEGSAA